MRILLLSAEYPPQQGGVGDYTVNLAHALAQRHVEVAVLTSSGDVQENNSLTVMRTVRGWGRTLHTDVRSAMNEWQPDVLHIQYQTGAYQMKPAINMLPSLVSVPTVVTFHDLRMPYLAPKVAPLRRYVTRMLLERADAVIVTNAEDEARLAGDSPIEDPDVYSLSHALHPPPYLIPIGANIEVCDMPDRAAARHAVNVADDQVLVAYFGLLNSSKGVHTIIEALPYLPSNVQLMIIGGGTSTPADEEYGQQVRTTIDDLNMADRVRWTGFLDACEVSRMLQISDLAVLPFADGASYRRGSLLATLAHGIPTITTAPRVPIEPTLRHEREVLFAPADEPISLALAIERLAADPALQQRLSAAGKRVANAFRWETIAARHEDVYRDLVANAAV